MVKSCLQVTPSSRPTCDKIIATPGLLNHMTGTLEGLENDIEEIGGNDNNLLKTIRCPLNLNMITERLPAPQYKKIKKCNSLSLDGSNSKCLKSAEKEKKVKSELQLVEQNSSEEKTKFNSDEKPK